MKTKFIIKQGGKTIATFANIRGAVNFNRQLNEKGFNSKVYEKGLI